MASEIRRCPKRGRGGEGLQDSRLWMLVLVGENVVRLLNTVWMDLETGFRGEEYNPGVSGCGSARKA